MAEKKFTEAGKAGQRIRDALAGAYRGFNSGFTNYVQEPLLNLYPQVIANPTYAATEAVAGALDVPINLGRFPYYDIETEEERNNRLLKEVDATKKEEIPTITVSKPKREAAQKLYRVMYAGKGAESTETYETKEEAEEAFKKSGAKGAIAEIDFGNKPKPGAKGKISNRNYLKGEVEKLPADEAEARKQKFIDQLAQTKKDKMVNDEKLKRIKSPEYKQEILAKRKKANDASLERYKNFVADIDAKRNSEATFNAYNKSIGLLQKAYSKAKQAGDFEKAFELDQRINNLTNEVPKEMGARRKYFEKIAIEERDAKKAMVAEKARATEEARVAEEAEKRRKISASNPDYSTFNNPFNNTIGMRY